MVLDSAGHVVWATVAGAEALDRAPDGLIGRRLAALVSSGSSRAQVAEFWNQSPDEPPRVKGQDNSIQPWRVDSDGSIHNAIA